MKRSLLIAALIAAVGLTSCTAHPAEQVPGTETENSSADATVSETQAETEQGEDASLYVGLLDPVLSVQKTDAIRVLCTPRIALGGDGETGTVKADADAGTLGLDIAILDGGSYKSSDVPAQRTFPSLGNDHVFAYICTAFRRAAAGSDEPGRYLSEYDLYEYRADGVTESIIAVHGTEQIVEYTLTNADSYRYNKYNGLVADNLTEDDAKQLAYARMEQLIGEGAKDRYVFTGMDINAQGLCVVSFARVICGRVTSEVVWLQFNREGVMHYFSCEMLTAFDPFMTLLSEERITAAREDIIRAAEAIPEIAGGNPTFGTGMLDVSTDGVVYLRLGASVTDNNGKNVQYQFVSPIKGAALIFPEA